MDTYSNYILIILLVLIAVAIVVFGRSRKQDMKELTLFHNEDKKDHKEFTAHLNLTDKKVARLVIRVEVLEGRADEPHPD